MCHEFSASTTRRNRFAILVNSYNTTNSTFSICNHVCNGISFCTHSQRTSSINTNTNIDIPFFSKNCGRNTTCLNKRRNFSFISVLFVAAIYILSHVPSNWERASSLNFTHEIFFSVTISINIIRKFLCKLYFNFCVLRLVLFHVCAYNHETQDAFQYCSNHPFERYEFDGFSHLHLCEDTVCLLFQIRRDIHSLILEKASAASVNLFKTSYCRHNINNRFCR